MRKMLLSFKPSVYKNIYAGVKIFEHRRNLLGFVPSQSHFYLDSNPDLLKYIEYRSLVRDINMKHDFSVIISDQVCVH